MRDDLLKILLTNDDGIHAPGLLAAAKTLSKVGELFIVAPSQEQSGVGSSLTLHDSILATPMDVQELIGIDNNLEYDNFNSTTRVNSIGYIFQFHHLLSEFSIIDNLI